jgi:hypothetical protein
MPPQPWIVSPSECDNCTGRDRQRKFCWPCWLKIRWDDLRRRFGRNADQN